MASNGSREIRKVGVLGSGVMGAGIAAHVANAGYPVVLLDIVPPNLAAGGDRSAFARGAIEKMKKQNPAPFLSESRAKLVTPGNCETSLLYNKIAQDMPKCGRHMPLGSDTMPTRLPPAAVEAVCAWIKAGAKKD